MRRMATPSQSERIQEILSMLPHRTGAPAVARISYKQSHSRQDHSRIGQRREWSAA